MKITACLRVLGSYTDTSAGCGTEIAYQRSSLLNLVRVVILFEEKGKVHTVSRINDVVVDCIIPYEAEKYCLCLVSDHCSYPFKHEHTCRRPRRGRVNQCVQTNYLLSSPRLSHDADGPMNQTFLLRELVVFQTS